MYKKIKRCLICGNKELTPILDLGVQALTGVFPKHKDDPVGRGPEAPGVVATPQSAKNFLRFGGFSFNRANHRAHSIPQIQRGYGADPPARNVEYVDPRAAFLDHCFSWAIVATLIKRSI